MGGRKCDQSLCNMCRGEGPEGPPPAPGTDGQRPGVPAPSPQPVDRPAPGQRLARGRGGPRAMPTPSPSGSSTL